MKSLTDFRAIGIIPALALAFLGGCAPQEEAGTSSGEPANSPQTFSVRGVIQELPGNEPEKVIIDHEEIPGYMPAMIMPFRVKSVAELAPIEPGMVVTFDYHVENQESWIENLKPTGELGQIKDTATILASSTPLLSKGDALPDYEFLDENGKKLKLSDFRGKTVAMTFVFSRCPVPEYCPAMMRNFRTVLDAMTKDPDATKNYHLLTISFDSFNDTPEIMKTWGAAYGHQSGQPWSLLTSETCCTVRDIAGNVGLKYGEINGSYQHNLRTVVLDPEGKIQRIFTDETWSVSELVEAIKAAGSGYTEDT